MTILPHIAIWAIYVIINGVIADVNNNMRLSAIKQHKTGAIKHFWWGLLYCGLCGIPFWFLFRNWYLLASITLLHVSVFPVFYNCLSLFQPFNLSTTSTALTDRFQVWLGLKNSELFNIGGFIISITLLILSFYYNL